LKKTKYVFISSKFLQMWCFQSRTIHQNLFWLLRIFQDDSTPCQQLISYTKGFLFFIHFEYL